LSDLEPRAFAARAPAKLNLCLYVGARRSDGLHEICSLFQSVTLADEVRLEPSGGDLDEIVCPGVAGPNLAARALAGFRERFDWRAPPLRITIEKRIPIAAGLGGGSADAAAVLRLAQAASGIEPPHRDLVELAFSLGADVPSQLEPGLRLVSGAGERVEDLGASPTLAFVLLGGVGWLSTADVYARADELEPRVQDLDAVANEVRQAVGRNAGGPALARFMHNDLEPATVALEPAARTALALLHEAEAAAAIVSGSGPAAFGLFASGFEAEAGRRYLAERWPAETILAASVDAAYAAPSELDTASADRSGIGQ
jgi:4-diphosphocytidyl-2-C-methyl-D-erythritol kinase